jgi:hypothetical protein
MKATEQLDCIASVIHRQFALPRDVFGLVHLLPSVRLVSCNDAPSMRRKARGSLSVAPNFATRKAPENPPPGAQRARDGPG